ncbi:MAG TPA: DUF3052 domain-containing protein [Mycobacteriales bacterium]|nr:DUF3052 domain-containing protein [Mycobacteriales bacterium]
MTAGYSSTPLAQKLGIKAGHLVRLVGAPDEFAAALEPLPDGVRVINRSGGSADVVVCFVSAYADLRRRFDVLAAAVFPDGGLWFAWPKRAAKVDTDITEDVIRDHAVAAGLVDNKVCAIDETWSGLRVVHRRENRR